MKVFINHEEELLDMVIELRETIVQVDTWYHGLTSFTLKDGTTITPAQHDSSCDVYPILERSKAIVEKYAPVRTISTKDKSEVKP